MPKFCANLSFLFTEYPFLERFERAAAAGFRGVEYLAPYEYPVAEIGACLREYDLTQVLFNLPAGDWAAGERGLACLPGREAEFRASVVQAADYATVLHCATLHCMSGIEPVGEAPGQTLARYVDNLRFAADRLGAQGITVTIEPINTRIDMPGYWLNSVERALDVLAEIDRPNVKLQLDLYHAHVMGNDVARVLAQCAGQIAHLQIADYPGRHEPGSGEMPCAALFAQIDASGYSGWVGCEYRPRTLTEAGLGWLHDLAAA